MKVLANFNLNNNDHLTNLAIYPHNIQPNKIYQVIAIEYDFYRVVGDNENSVKYADIYMAYLVNLLGTDMLCHRLEQLYLQSINDNIHHFSFWQKQWLKHVFNVENAIEIRQFIPTFQKTIKQYLENLK